MRITLHRCFMVALGVSGAFWLWFVFQGQRMDADDRAFYATQVQPYFQERKKHSEDFKRATQDRRKGIGTPLPKANDLSEPPVNEWATRVLRRAELRGRQFDVEMVFFVTSYAWMITAFIQGLVRMRRRDAPERAPDPGAGADLAAFTREGGHFVARMGGTGRAVSMGHAHEVEVDGPRAHLIFRHVLVVTSFVGNRRYDIFEVPFADVIAARIWRGKGLDTLVLRTAKGKVSVRSDIGQFERLAAIVSDAGEVNRSSPEQYRALLAREPVVRVPWWGWLPIVMAVAVVAWVWFAVM